MLCIRRERDFKRERERENEREGDRERQGERERLKENSYHWILVVNKVIPAPSTQLINYNLKKFPFLSSSTNNSEYESNSTKIQVIDFTKLHHNH